MTVYLGGLVEDSSFNGASGRIVGKSANSNRVFVLTPSGIVYAVKPINVSEDPFSFFK